MFWPYSFRHTINLFYDQWCGLLGIGPDQDVYAEELHDDLAAHYHFDRQGQLMERIEEDPTSGITLPRAHLPAGTIEPTPVRVAHPLNFGPELVDTSLDMELMRSLVHQLSLPERLFLQTAGLLPVEVPPPAILGILDSRVTSEAEIEPGQFAVCRRLRVAYRPPASPVAGSDRYQLCTFAVLQSLDLAELDQPLTETLLPATVLGIELMWPTDVIAAGNQLYVADSANGRTGRTSRIGVFERRL